MLHRLRSRALPSLVLRALLLAGLALGASSAAADDFDRPGFYIGAGGTYQRNVFENRLEDELQDALQGTPFSNSNLSIDDSGGVNAVAGYRVFSFFAVELQYEWIDEYSVDAKQVPGLGSVNLYDMEAHTLTANTKWIIPFWRIQPYLLLGGGFATYDVDRGFGGTVLNNAGIKIKDGSETDFAARGGGGVDLYVTKHILVNAQASVLLTTLEKPGISDISELNYVAFGAGLQYRF